MLAMASNGWIKTKSFYNQSFLLFFSDYFDARFDTLNFFFHYMKS